MKCVICMQGDTQPGVTTVTLERGSLTMVIKEVPAQVCSNCGEAYVDGKAAKRLLKTAEKAAKSGAHVEIRSFEAA